MFRSLYWRSKWGIFYLSMMLQELQFLHLYTIDSLKEVKMMEVFVCKTWEGLMEYTFPYNQND